MITNPIPDYTIQEIIKIFVDNHPEIYIKMKDTEHGYLNQGTNPHHLEGSIWAHTCMVMKEAQNQSVVIKLAALCHDLGKPYVYEDIEHKQVRRFAQHEAVSTFYAREVLRSFELDYKQTERILEIVSQHGSLYNYFTDGRIPEKNFEKISGMFSYETFNDLVVFYSCDHNGRFYDPKISINDNMVYEDFTKILELMKVKADTELKERGTTILPGIITVLVGAPRSGKSTFIEKFGLDTTDNIISRDALVEEFGIGANYSEKWKSLTKDQQSEIDKELQHRYQTALKEKKCIVIDMTNMSKKSRKKWLVDKKAQDYHKKAIVFIEPKSVLMSRMTPEKNIPEFVIDTMMKSFVWPNLAEFDTVSLFDF